MDNRHIFKRALESLGKAPHNTRWQSPWRREFQMPDDFDTGEPYHHTLTLRSDIEKLLAKHKIKLMLYERVPGYNLGTDEICMPKPSLARSRLRWYQTLFHEMGHWTGPRLRKAMQEVNHPIGIGVEELTAELVSAFMCEAHNIKGEGFADYIDGWASVVPKEMYPVPMKQAIEATNYLLK